jgi:hypothetical protein
MQKDFLLLSNCNMRILESVNYDIKLYIGSREGYNGPKFSREDLIASLKEHPGEALSLRVSPCCFVVGDWHEDGWEVACINSPGTHKLSMSEAREFMGKLAGFLLKKLKQRRVTVCDCYECRTYEDE